MKNSLIVNWLRFLKPSLLWTPSTIPNDIRSPSKFPPTEVTHEFSMPPQIRVLFCHTKLNKWLVGTYRCHCMNPLNHGTLIVKFLSHVSFQELESSSRKEIQSVWKRSKDTITPGVLLLLLIFSTCPLFRVILLLQSQHPLNHHPSRSCLLSLSILLWRSVQSSPSMKDSSLGGGGRMRLWF